jgi:hypothetical protein
VGIRTFFRRGTKTENSPDRSERLRDLIAIGCSITNGSYKAARPFLAARHGRNKFISPWALYYEADNMFLAAHKLAKEIGDKRKEAEVYYHWARLQLRPPSKSIMFVAPDPYIDPADLIRSERAKAVGEDEAPDKALVQSNPGLALTFFLQAIPLAEETGHDVVVAASLLYSAQIYKGRGDTTKYQAQIEKLRQKTTPIAETKTPLPPWLLDEINAELRP